MIRKKLATRLIITASLITVSASLLSGCKKTEPVQKNNQDKPTEITMLYRDEGSYPYREDWTIWSEIEKKANVKLKPTVVPASDWNTKVKLLVSAGDAPDFISRMSNEETVQFVPSGAVVPVSDYLDKLPNFKEKVAKYKVEKDIKEQYVQEDGKYYNLPGIVETPWIEVHIAYRMDIMDKLGLKVPKDHNELYEVLKAMKKAYPNQYVWADKWNGKNSSAAFGGSWGANLGEWHMGNDAYYDAKNDKFISNGTSEDYKEWLKFMSKLVKEGIYDPETFTTSGDKIVEKLTTGKAFVSISNLTEVIEWNEFGQKNVGKDFKFEQQLIPAGPKGALGRKINNFQHGVVIPASTKKKAHFDQVLKFVDWMYYSDEGMELTYWGVEGKTFEKSGGKKQPLKDINYRWMNPGQPKDMRKDFGIGNMAFMGAQSSEILYELMPPEEQALQKKYMNERPTQKTAPGILFTKDQREEAELLNSKISDYVKQMYVKFIVGQASIEKDWDAYVKELKAKGLDKYLDLVNKAYDETKKKRK